MNSLALQRHDLFLLATGLEIVLLLVILGRRPIWQLYQFRRELRTVSTRLSDERLPALLAQVEHQIADALRDCADSWSYAFRLSLHVIEVAVAGPDLPPPPAAWQERDGWWRVSRAALAGAATSSTSPAVTSAPPCPVALGVNGRDLVLLDLARVPGVLTLSGPDQPVFSVLCAMAAQLSTGLLDRHPVDLLVADGVHPRFNGPTLTAALHALESGPGLTEDKLTVLVCGRPSAQQAQRISTLSQQLPLLRIVTAGPYSGSGWMLLLSSNFQLTAEDLGLHANAGSLERGVAQAVRERQWASVSARDLVRAS